MKPTIGRIVRFVDEDNQIWPAIVTLVHFDTTVSLQVFRQSDIVPATSVAFMEKGAGVHNTWHWPERA